MNFYISGLTLCSVYLYSLLGLVFNRVTDEELEYTIRLRHEVSTANTWRTQRIAPGVDRPGPRVVKSVIACGNSIS